MKPMFEKVIPSPSASWRFWRYEIDEIEFNWHYHPEYEIALTLNSFGQRYVGDNIAEYGDIDMVLCGPHLPHTWHSYDSVKGTEQRVYVAQLPAVWLETLVSSMPDLATHKVLLEKSLRGIRFSQHVAKKAIALFESMEVAPVSERLILLLQVLELMSQDTQTEILASAGYRVEITADQSTDKLDKIMRFIHQHYTRPLLAEEVAKIVHMSTPHFHRFIKQRTEQTFTELVNQLRISKACSLLTNTKTPISTISDMCGFNCLSNFNRRFAATKRMTPTAFRKTYQRRHALL
ncbi:AraC family transcriptional regulator [Pseudoalteromonas sp. T1lg65]|uniref:AraC family transcriptional regulator n=1 Tax=Pseudoalteromonas sp. T1lg65 TaxID=2077101 RepID=UPI003F78D0B8